MIASNHYKIDKELIKYINEVIEKDGKDSYRLAFKPLDEYRSIQKKFFGSIIDIQDTEITVYIKDLTVYPHGYSISDKVESIDFRNTFMTTITEMSQSEFRCIIKNIKYLNFSCVTFSKTIRHLRMFSDLPKLTYLDLSNAVITNLTSLNQAFVNNENLKQINLNGLKYTNQYMDLSFTFYNCSKLNKIDLSFLNEAMLTSVIGAFSDCKELEEIKGFEDTDISSCRTLEMLFFNCRKLKEISIPETNAKTLCNLVTTFGETHSLKKLNIINNSDDGVKHISVKKIFLDSNKDIEININKPYEIMYEEPDFLDIDSINQETHISEKMFEQRIDVTTKLITQIDTNINKLVSYDKIDLSNSLLDKLYHMDYTLELMQVKSQYRENLIAKHKLLNTDVFYYVYYPTFLLIIQSNNQDDLKISIVAEKIYMNIKEDIHCNLNIQCIYL